MLDVAQVSCSSQADGPSRAGKQAGVYCLQYREDGCSGLPGVALHSIVLSHVGMCSLIRAIQVDKSQGEL